MIVLTAGPVLAAPTVAVPDVDGMTKTAAAGAVQKAGLKPVFTGTPATIVVAQNPAAGARVAGGQPVIVRLGSVSASIVVPYLTGLARGDAIAAVQKAGLTPVFEGQGAVVHSQAPRAGAMVARNTDVQMQ